MNLNQYFHSMYQLNSLTVYYIAVILLQHDLAWQCHLQGVHNKLKVIYSKVDYICEFHNLQYILLLITLCVWIKYVNFLMLLCKLLNNSYVFICCGMTEQQHIVLKVHSHVSSHSRPFLICSHLFHLSFVCSGSWLTIFFVPHNSYHNVLILNSFLVSLCYSFVLYHQIIISFSSDSIK